MFTIVIAAPAFSSQPVTAHTACGDAVGVSQPGGIAAFRGIPYGTADRWQPPVAAPCWHGDLNATKDGPYCPGMHPAARGPDTEEACLSLNVFAPLAAMPPADGGGDGGGPVGGGGGGGGLPVFVWLYGGSLVLGSVASYGPIENLVSGSNGRVLLVTMNYRLGALGFATLPELAAADPRGVGGNYGASFRIVPRNFSAEFLPRPVPQDSSTNSSRWSGWLPTPRHSVATRQR
jgi:carboxylesterase type B